MTEVHTQSECDHAEAMRHANDGFAHRDRGEHEAAVAAFRKAWDLERRAAMSLIDQPLEPSRSILFRSAASLALLCGEYDEARKLAHLGLGGSPSRRVREALETILADVQANGLARGINDLSGELRRFPGVFDFDELPAPLWEQVA